MNIGRMWDEKFSREGFLYGKAPNAYLKGIIDAMAPGSHILFLGEGEGRNACYAAGRGLRSHAIDASAVGLEKLGRLALECGVEVETTLLDLQDWQPDRDYDAVLSSYLHLAEPLRSDVFSKALASLKPGALFAGEFFAQEQMSRDSGGPKVPELLYKTEDFSALLPPGWTVRELRQCRVTLEEGRGHRGEAEVVRVAFAPPKIEGRRA